MATGGAGETAIYAGVELGGTKCIAILARGPDAVLARETVPTTTPDATLGRLSEIIADWRQAHRFRALGIASFGPLDLDPHSPGYGRITSTPKPGWRDCDVAGALGSAAGMAPRFDTDVNGAALAEMRWGAGQGMADFAYITVGTGVGVGLIVSGRPTRGFAHCELGHIRVARVAGDDFPGVCPYHGDCVEGLTSGPSIQARLGPRSLGELAPGDPIWALVADALAQLCHTIVCAAAPRAVAIGGGVIGGQPHLLGAIEERLVASLNGYMDVPSANGPYVRAPGLGADAGPLGAIALAMGD